MKSKVYLVGEIFILKRSIPKPEKVFPQHQTVQIALHFAQLVRSKSSRFTTVITFNVPIIFQMPVLRGIRIYPKNTKYTRFVSLSWNYRATTRNIDETISFIKWLCSSHLIRYRVQAVTVQTWSANKPCHRGRYLIITTTRDWYSQETYF